MLTFLDFPVGGLAAIVLVGWVRGVISALLGVPGIFEPAVRETIEMLYEFEEPFVVDHSDFTRTFGDHATPLGETVRQTVRWYRTLG